MIDHTYATIISILPFDVTETKPGLTPNEYIVKGTEGDKIGLTIIPNNVFYTINPDPLSDAKEVRHIPVPVPAIEVAQAIINDYVSALLAVEPPIALPGWVAIRGNYSDRKVVTTEFMKEIMGAREAQNKWFRNLIDIADDSWSKTRSPLGISDLQRFACRGLDYKRDWLNPLPSEVINKCPVCKSGINDGALKCIACGHILNKKMYDEVMAGAK